MKAEEAVEYINNIVLNKLSKNLDQKQKLIIEGTWNNKNYQTISSESGININTLMRDAGPKLWDLLGLVFGETIAKKNLVDVVTRYKELGEDLHFQSTTLPLNTDAKNSAENKQKDTTNYLEKGIPNLTNINLYDVQYEDIKQINKIILKPDQKNLVLLIKGPSQVGKTTIMAKLYEDIKKGFNYALWFSFIEPLSSLIESFHELFGTPITTNLTEIEKIIPLILDKLRDYKCLLVLDNLENICQRSLDNQQENIIIKQFILRLVTEKNKSFILIPIQHQYLNQENLNLDQHQDKFKSYDLNLSGDKILNIFEQHFQENFSKVMEIEDGVSDYWNSDKKDHDSQYLQVECQDNFRKLIDMLKRIDTLKITFRQYQELRPIDDQLTKRIKHITKDYPEHSRNLLEYIKDEYLSNNNSKNQNFPLEMKAILSNEKFNQERVWQDLLLLQEGGLITFLEGGKITLGTKLKTIFPD